ncbi:MAG TPA: hypothetical protein VFJ09_01605 [Nocardioidaceae bacterium]|nr:hypothetical protein [Nocardioidaceae bacterium]
MTANGWCNYEGCWNVVDGLHANNQSNLEFGYGPTTLGTGKLTAKHSINGSQMQTYTTFRASIPTQAIYAEGNLLRGDPSTVGSVVDGQIQYEYKASLAAATTWHPKWAYQSDYYNSYDTQYTNHSNVIQYSWEVAGYPGFWWAYQEGCIAHDLDNNNKYQFEDSENLFKDPAGSGWNS